MCGEHFGEKWLPLHHPGGRYTLVVVEGSFPLITVKGFENENNINLLIYSYAVNTVHVLKLSISHKVFQLKDWIKMAIFLQK